MVERIWDNDDQDWKDPAKKNSILKRMLVQSDWEVAKQGAVSSATVNVDLNGVILYSKAAAETGSWSTARYKNQISLKSYSKCIITATASELMSSFFINYMIKDRAINNFEVDGDYITTSGTHVKEIDIASLSAGYFGITFRGGTVEITDITLVK